MDRLDLSRTVIPYKVECPLFGSDGDNTRVINDDPVSDDIKKAIVDRVNAAPVVGRGE